MRRNAALLLMLCLAFLVARAAGIAFHWLGRAAVKFISRTPFGNFLDDSGFGP